MSERSLATRPTFLFSTTTDKPTRRVVCRSCGWERSGNGPNVFPAADAHRCPVFEETRRIANVLWHESVDQFGCGNDYPGELLERMIERIGGWSE